MPGGDSGIRTHGPVSGPLPFESSAISQTLPHLHVTWRPQGGTIPYLVIDSDVCRPLHYAGVNFGGMQFNSEQRLHVSNSAILSSSKYAI